MLKEHTEGETWTLSDCPGVCVVRGTRAISVRCELWGSVHADAWLGQKACALGKGVQILIGSLVQPLYMFLVSCETLGHTLQNELGRKCTVCQTLPLIFTVLSY